ncbi:small-conductance mechanosensitive channel [Rhodobium orientis]|uniref:Small-conductance mechanosensitive channel n=1 Tax=Rhodobium orientis TaxID=34017 RepID=A0A327JW12_9HYPH|nr:mechanosensitive ion channel family protein [Rhodobium orientis]MBB4302725.1 small-conductance mechanosensitive channel [Rhodobium orientis]MBK5948507.1 hypothetical protein [Rhodobium orientis]RAI29776.1 hypothetical protein CH339_01805 [Rhodobium orientis]
MEEQLIDVEVPAAVTTAVGTVNRMVEGFFAMLPQIAIAIVLFLMMVVIASVARALAKRLVSARAPAGVGIAIGRIVHVAVIFFGLLVAVAVIAPSVGAAELLQILGVGSVAIGFAFRDILQNFLAGLLILLRQPFSIGDWVQFGDHSGLVTEISTRSTWIRTFNGRDVSIPNGEIFTNPIMIMTRDPVMRSDYVFGISYDADIDRALEVILGTVKSFDAVIGDPPPDAGVSDLADSSVNIQARWWTKVADAYFTRMEILAAVKKALDEAGIDIPYPHRRLVVDEYALNKVSERSEPGDKGLVAANG